MKIQQLLAQAVKNLQRNRQRTVLTMVGIIIGISAIITIVAIGEGFKTQIISQVSEGTDTKMELNVLFEPDSNRVIDESQAFFNERDVRLLSQKSYIEVAELSFDETFLAPMISSEIRGEVIQTTVSSVAYTEYHEIIGRNLQVSDSERLRKVAVVDATLLPETQQLNHYLGSGVTIDLITYEIVGIVPQAQEEQTVLFAQTTGIQLPQAVYTTYIGHSTVASGIRLIVNDDSEIAEVITDIEATLNTSGSQQAQGTYVVFDQSGMTAVLGVFLNTITTFIALVAAISLFIAGIGVMNMMYTSVAERTSEIGVKRALGAKRSDIRKEFLIEGIVLTLISGGIGYIVGLFLAMIAGYFLKLTIHPTMTTALITIGISTLIGVLASYLPAQVAANQNVIEILK
ncbi:MAG: ABC transporter permease [Culicoidibacterales bacterium]